MRDSIPLQTRALSKTFKRKRKQAKKAGGATNGQVTALSDISIELGRGEVYGLLGPNGCGKSTLVRVVSTLLLADEGTATVFGHDVVREAHAVRRLVNRVSVEAAFFKKLSSAENLLYAARLYGLSRREASERAEGILRGLGFPMKRLNESMEELSRGQQQKVAIARGLFTSPVLLLLDEPTTGLDPRSKRDVQGFIRSITEGHDATVLFTTHDMAEADSLCHRVAIMDNGKIVAEGTPTELKARVKTEALPAPTLEDVFMELTGKSLEEEEEP
jgi:ABC-2 type transport system ATP-binding protein